MSEPEKRKVADLWEKSIAAAFRDLQWRFKGHDALVPEPNIPFDGNLERSLGDGVVSANERLFLLELKAEASGRSAEWQQGREKFAYQALKKHIEKAEKNRDFEATREEFELSLGGHFFLYWSGIGGARDTRMRPGVLAVSPYLLDLAQHSPISQLLTCEKLSVDYSLGAIERREEDSDLCVAKDKLRATRFFDGNGTLLCRSQKTERVIDLGLTPSDMQRYVNWLISNQADKDLPINAILASQNGAVCQFVWHIDDLVGLIHSLVSTPHPLQPPNHADPERVRQSWASVEMPHPDVQLPVMRR